jgi:phosphate transport system substrate-binding protein
MKTSSYLICSALLLLACQRGDTEKSKSEVKTGTLEICGAYALSPLVQAWATAYQRTYPELKVNIHPVGSAIGLTNLLEERCDMAMISGEIHPGAGETIRAFPVARMGVVLVINKANPSYDVIRRKGLTRSAIAGLFTNQNLVTWGELTEDANHDPVHRYIRSDSAGATDVIAHFLWCMPADLTGKGISGENAMVEAVSKDPLAIGYCNFISAIDPAKGVFVPGIAVVPLDLNCTRNIEPPEAFYDSVLTLRRAMWTGRFPCSLVRDLYLATKGKPGTFESVDFLGWVLTEGQDMIEKQGYIPLRSHQIRMALEALEK